ncbi:MAG TPA: hypothetical protein VGK59_15095 [Ohtaekwangia sp.]
MVIYNSQKNQLVLTIPDAGFKEMDRYYKSIIQLLSKIEIENCDPEFKENLKAVYELLMHLQPQTTPE